VFSSNHLATNNTIEVYLIFTNRSSGAGVEWFITLTQINSDRDSCVDKATVYKLYRCPIFEPRTCIMHSCFETIGHFVLTESDAWMAQLKDAKELIETYVTLLSIMLYLLALRRLDILTTR